MRGLEKPRRAVAVAAQEALGIVPLAAPVTTGRVAEGGMDQRVLSVQRRRVGLGQMKREMRHACAEEAGRGGAAPELGDSMALGEQGLDDEPADEPGRAGDRDPQGAASGGGSVARSGTAPSPA